MGGGVVRDFLYTAQQIGVANPIATNKSSLVRYYKCDSSAFASQTDSSQYGRNSQGWGGYNSSAPGLPAPGFLINQHYPTFGASFQAGHGFSNVFTWNGNQDSDGAGGHIDDFINRSWSLVFAGLKPHDMSVNRAWHGVGSGSNVGGTLDINTDGSITVTSNINNPVSSASGVIQQYVPYLLIMSYNNSAQTITVYLGDWNGNWTTPINAAAGAAITTSAPFPVVGGDRAGGRADGFLDDYAVYLGHALTASEAQQLFIASGYQDELPTYARSLGHRNGPFNYPYPGSQAIASNSAAAVTEFAGKADSTQINGAGSFNWNQFTTSTYIVSGSFRKNPANWIKVNGPTHYGDQTQVMLYEDVPAPYSHLPPSFNPSSGSDAHLAIWCPDTDEYWDFGVVSNSGTSGAPVWNTVYGNKQTYMSLFLGAFPNGQGATATGIPNLQGVPTAAEIENAIYNGVPIPHGLAAVMYDGLQSNVWPANRHDGGKTGSNVIEGQTYRIQHTAAASAAIAAMPHPTGRAIAQAAQTYGVVIVDRNVFATLLQTEDTHSALANNGGVNNPYTTDPTGEPALGGILNGQAFSVNTMSGFPWTLMEVLDASQINPGDASQPIRPTVTGLSGQHLQGIITLTWSDDYLTQWWNVYQKVVQTITLSSGLSTGAPITALPVIGLTNAIPSGSKITLTSGANTQTFTTSGVSPVGDTSVAVASLTPNFAYPTNTSITLHNQIARTYWPQYTVYNPSSSITFNITAQNGGGESPLGVDFTPPLPVHTRRRPRGQIS